MTVKVILEHLETHLVAVFEAAIILGIFLDGVVRQMHILIIRVVRVDIEF